MPSKKLPIYFEEYLDEKFEHVVYKIGEVKKDVSAIKHQLIILNGTTKNHKVKISLIRSRIKLIWIVLGIFTVLFGIIFGVYDVDGRNVLGGIVSLLSGF